MARRTPEVKSSIRVFPQSDRPLRRVKGPRSGALLFSALACLSLTACSDRVQTMRLGEKPLEQKLIDTASNLRIEEWQIGSPSEADRRSIDIDTTADWSVHKTVLHGGRQEGVDAIVVDNGLLSFTVVPSRGMGLWDIYCRDPAGGDGLPLDWDSPVEEIVHPSLLNLEARGGLGWLEGFSEAINRCGLASLGAPGPDSVPSNTGAPVEVNLTLHGKISSIPAREVEVVIEPPPSRRIRIRGVVDETMMFGTQLRLISEVWTTPGSKALHIADEIVNLGSGEEEMEILYHANFGAPLLEEGARLVAPVRRVFPRDARAAEGDMQDWDVYGAPQTGYLEQVHLLELWADSEARTEALLRNRAGDRGVALRYSTAELPCLTMWKNTQAEADGYVTGIEPGTNYPMHRSVERSAGRLMKLPGGGSYRASLTVEAQMSAADVQSSEARIDALRAGRDQRVDTTPAG